MSLLDIQCLTEIQLPSQMLSCQDVNTVCAVCTTRGFYFFYNSKYLSPSLSLTLRRTRTIRGNSYEVFSALCVQHSAVQQRRSWTLRSLYRQSFSEVEETNIWTVHSEFGKVNIATIAATQHKAARFMGNLHPYQA
jgi:hypothetical protein